MWSSNCSQNSVVSNTKNVIDWPSMCWVGAAGEVSKASLYPSCWPSLDIKKTAKQTRTIDRFPQFMHADVTYIRFYLLHVKYSTCSLLHKSCWRLAGYDKLLTFLSCILQFTISHSPQQVGCLDTLQFCCFSFNFCDNKVTFETVMLCAVQVLFMGPLTLHYLDGVFQIYLGKVICKLHVFFSCRH